MKGVKMAHQRLVKWMSEIEELPAKENLPGTRLSQGNDFSASSGDTCTSVRGNNIDGTSGGTTAKRTIFCEPTSMTGGNSFCSGEHNTSAASTSSGLTATDGISSGSADRTTATSYVSPDGVGCSRAPRVLLGCSGSVATIKVPLIAEALQMCGVNVVVLPTAPALHFLSAAATGQQCIKKNVCVLAHNTTELEDKPETSQTTQEQKSHDLKFDKKQSNSDSEAVQSKESHHGGSEHYNLMSTEDKKELTCTYLLETEASRGFRSDSSVTKCFRCSQLFHSHELGPVSKELDAASFSETKQEMDSSSVSSSSKASVYVCMWCQVQNLYPDLNIAGDEMEWGAWRGRGDLVLHIQLRRWADVFVIAPLSANTLAKLACGLCDNLLTCVARAWDPQKPLLFCPAMNTFMYDHPFTAQQVRTLKDLGYIEVPAVSKRLMCGDVGGGAMAEVSSIVSAVRDALLTRGFRLPVRNC